MKMKTLLFSLSALVFFAACNSKESVNNNAQASNPEQQANILPTVAEKTPEPIKEEI